MDKVTSNHYRLTQDDFSGGLVSMDMAGGRVKMSGRNVHTGANMVAYLHEPLCIGCDTPVAADGVCAACNCLHEDLVRAP